VRLRADQVGRDRLAAAACGEPGFRSPGTGTLGGGVEVEVPRPPRNGYAHDEKQRPRTSRAGKYRTAQDGRSDCPGHQVLPDRCSLRGLTACGGRKFSSAVNRLRARSVGSLGIELMKSKDPMDRPDWSSYEGIPGDRPYGMEW